ncbi:MAG: glycosyltransferase family 87 protein [Pseudomonadota bacterium]
MSTPSRAHAAIADLPWLDGPRATAWVRILAAVTAVGVVAFTALALANRGLDPTGKPLGTDFLAFWSAAKAALGGPAASVYDAARLAPVQTAAFGGVDVGYAPFPYPPTFLLLCLPFGLVPYLPALAAWVTASGYAYVRAIRGWMPSAGGSRVAALAFPAVVINLAHGQTAFLTTALFAGGTLLLGHRDILAGLLLGALVMKPHLGVLIPVALLASRNWRAVAGAGVSFTTLVVVSALVFGTDVWRALPAQLDAQRVIVEQGLLDPAKLQSLFGAARLLGAGLATAYGLQIAAGLAAAATVAVVAWRRPDARGLGPVLVAATLLTGPYLLDYDLVLAAIPLAWMLARGQAAGFRSWEKIVLLLAYVLPLISRITAMQAGIPVAPLVLAALLVITVRRALSDAG